MTATAPSRDLDAPQLPVARTVNHRLHAVLTLGTCGMWAVVWAGVAVWTAKHNHRQVMAYAKQACRHRRVQELRTCRSRTTARTVERIPGTG